MRCRYSARSGFELLGSNGALRRFVAELRTAATTKQSGQFACDQDNSGTAPYEETIQAIDITPATGSVRISYDQPVMRVAGGPEELNLLAANIYTLTMEDAPHLHVDYYPGHFYVASDSEPLVVTRLGRT
jgi:hypothetical protein